MMYLRGLKVFRGRNVQDIVMIGAYMADNSDELDRLIKKIEKRRRWLDGMTIIDFQSDYERKRFDQ